MIELGEEVVFDLSTNPWDSMRTGMDLDLLVNHPETDAEVAMFEVKRVRLNINTRTVSIQDWPNESDLPMMNTLDFPAINPNYLGQKNRYVYGWVSIDWWRMYLVKKDLVDTTSYKTWSETKLNRNLSLKYCYRFTESHYPGEMIFIANPEGVEEDDGVLITISFNGETQQSYVLLLDAKTFEEIDRAYLPINIPFSFHGNWFPELY